MPKAGERQLKIGTTQEGLAIKKGKVYICGAGPGDPKLLTIRALELLNSCDVILYDRLVANEIISEIPEVSEKIYVGRSVGDPTTHQEETNKLMVKFALQGKQVLRLKGGDPFIFGRGAEEAEFLVANGIEFEIVPGISSAVASAAYAGIPLTHRALASSVAIVTGHEEEGKDTGPAVEWSRLAKSVDTIVILMGIGQLSQISKELMASGRDPQTPVAIIEKGTTENQRVITSSLDTISCAAKEFKVKPPAIIVIGKVVSVQKTIGNWFKKT